MVTFLAIAVSPAPKSAPRSDYKIWYLELNDRKEVIGIGVKDREHVVKDLFDCYRKTGRSNWRAFKQGEEASTPIEIFDFIAHNLQENTHFGNLPTLSQFQHTIKMLELKFEIQQVA